MHFYFCKVKNLHLGLFRKRELDLSDIISGCKAGKSSAQKLLFEKYYGYTKKICVRYSSDYEQAEEMLNDSFLKVFKHINSYNESHSFLAWLKTITVRTCIDYYRKYNSKAVMMDVNDVHYLESNDASVLNQLGAEEILALVQKLPPSYRAVFSLFVVDGYSHAEIAEMLGINEGTSRSNLAKARLKLQEWIKDIR